LPGGGPQDLDRRIGKEIGHFPIFDRKVRRLIELPPVQLIPQLEQIDLPDGLAVDQGGRPAGLRHALDLDPTASPHRHVDVLAAGSETDPDVAG
jgi:hypothetical protein